MGNPLLCYTVDWLKEAGIKEIIITVNYVAELKKIRTLFRGDPLVVVTSNKSRESSAQCFRPLRNLLDERFLFVYGHAPVPPEHIRKLTTITNRGIVVSLYQTTTQREEAKKMVRFDGSRVIITKRGNLFIEPPHVVDRKLLNLLIKSESWKTSFQDYRGYFVGVRAHHPPEFHYRKDFYQVRRWLTKQIRELRRN